MSFLDISNASLNLSNELNNLGKFSATGSLIIGDVCNPLVVLPGRLFFDDTQIVGDVFVFDADADFFQTVIVGNFVADSCGVDLAFTNTIGDVHLISSGIGIDGLATLGDVFIQSGFIIDASDLSIGFDSRLLVLDLDSATFIGFTTMQFGSRLSSCNGIEYVLGSFHANGPGLTQIGSKFVDDAGPSCGGRFESANGCGVAGRATAAN